MKQYLKHNYTDHFENIKEISPFCIALFCNHTDQFHILGFLVRTHLQIIRTKITFSAFQSVYIRKSYGPKLHSRFFSPYTFKNHTDQFHNHTFLVRTNLHIIRTKITFSAFQSVHIYKSYGPISYSRLFSPYTFINHTDQNFILGFLVRTHS